MSGIRSKSIARFMRLQLGVISFLELALKRIQAYDAELHLLAMGDSTLKHDFALESEINLQSIVVEVVAVAAICQD